MDKAKRLRRKHGVRRADIQQEWRNRSRFRQPEKLHRAIYPQKDVVDKYRDRLKDVGKGSIRYRSPEQTDFEVVRNSWKEPQSCPPRFASNKRKGCARQ